MRPAVTKWNTRDCVECGERWQSKVPLYVNVCKECRDAAVAPTIELLRSIATMNPLEAYIRGILHVKMLDHDREAIMALGAILDSLRVPEPVSGQR